jgi:hypothetical protein
MSQATGAVVGVYESMKDAEAAVATLLEQGVPAEQVSIVGHPLCHPASTPSFRVTARWLTRQRRRPRSNNEGPTTARRKPCNTPRWVN